MKLVDLGDASNRGVIDYDKNIIYLNQNMKYGADTYIDLSHEYSHKIQSELVNHIDEYQKDSPEYKYLSLVKAQIKQEIRKIQAFGISFNGDLYFRPKANVPDSLCKLTSPMYNLQTIERNAQEVEQGALEYLKQCYGNKLKTTIEPRLQDSVQEINQMYGSNWSNAQMFQIIDNALLCINENRGPSQYADFTATLMYDMTCHLYAKHELWDKTDEKRTACFEILNKNRKSIAMRDSYEHPFAVYGADARVGEYVVLNEYDKMDLLMRPRQTSEVIAEMSHREKISNASYIIFALRIEDPNRIIPLIQDVIDPLKDWVIKYLGDLNEDVLQHLEKTLNWDIAEEYVLRQRQEITNSENINMSHSILKETFDFGFYKDVLHEQNEVMERDER